VPEHASRWGHSGTACARACKQVGPACAGACKQVGSSRHCCRHVYLWGAAETRDRRARGGGCACRSCPVTHPGLRTQLLFCLQQQFASPPLSLPSLSSSSSPSQPPPQSKASAALSSECCLHRCITGNSSKRSTQLRCPSPQERAHWKAKALGDESALTQ